MFLWDDYINLKTQSVKPEGNYVYYRNGLDRFLDVMDICSCQNFD